MSLDKLHPMAWYFMPSIYGGANVDGESLGSSHNPKIENNPCIVLNLVKGTLITPTIEKMKYNDWLST